METSNKSIRERLKELENDIQTQLDRLNNPECTEEERKKILENLNSIAELD